jgi:membrane protease YdiL (CAAX protease family)
MVVTSTDNVTAKRTLLIVAVFVVLTFLASGALLLLQSATGIDGGVLLLPPFGPAIGAALTWLLFRRDIAAAAPKRVVRQRFIAHLVLAIGACVVYGLVLAMVTLLQGPPLVGAHLIAGVPFAILVLLQLSAALGEEIGWRGLMQPMLERRWGRLAASIVVGLVWAVWHIRIFSAGPLIAILFVLTTVVFAVLLGYLASGSIWQRILTAAVIHWLVNVALLVVAGDRTGDLQASVASGIAMVVTTAAFLAMFGLAQRKRARERALAA